MDIDLEKRDSASPLTIDADSTTKQEIESKTLPDDSFETLSQATERMSQREERGADLTNDGDSEKEDIVTWDGPLDKENPRNWSPTRKWLIVATTCLMTFCVTFSSSVFSAAVAATAEEFDTSSEVMVLGVSLFVLGFAISKLTATVGRPSKT